MRCIIDVVTGETFIAICESTEALKHCDYEVIQKTSRGTFIVKAPRADG